jgi:mycothiol synthase
VAAPQTRGGPADRPQRVETLTALTGDLVEAVLRVVTAATEADGVRPLSEDVMLDLKAGPPTGGSRGLHLLLTERPGGGTDVVGYAHLRPGDAADGPAVEIVIRPDRRRHGLGRRLLTCLAARTPDGRLRVWAHGDRPEARALAASLGFRQGRRLERWSASLRRPLPRLTLPDGVTLRPFRPRLDDEAWLAVNARAFAGHPEQGGWTVHDLHTRLGEPWFDPDGFLLAESLGEVVGFHWTKVHDTSPARGGEPTGEVYVIGVDPSWQGRGLGRALVVAGLERLRARGLHRSMLYVESDNAPAKATYESLGFTPQDVDVMFFGKIIQIRATSE